MAIGARVNVVVRIDSAAGIIIAAPIPWTSRAPTSITSVLATPPISDETPNNDGPATSNRRRPTRSEARPPSSMKPP